MQIYISDKITNDEYTHKRYNRVIIFNSQVLLHCCWINADVSHRKRLVIGFSNTISENLYEDLLTRNLKSSC